MLRTKITTVIFLVVIKIFFGYTLSDSEIPIHLDGSTYKSNNDDDDADVDLLMQQHQEEIHLEDFFWTGSGDGPPDYVKNVHTGISKGKNVIVKTETVVATVYIDGKNDIENNNGKNNPLLPSCTDCEKNELPSFFNMTTNDRRYWLLTIISGFLRPKDYILLEDKLAKLYRLAFTRQQSKHLGIENDGKNFENLSTREKRQEKQIYQQQNNNNDSSLIELEMHKISNGNQSITHQLDENYSFDWRQHVVLPLFDPLLIKSNDKYKDDTNGIIKTQTDPSASSKFITNFSPDKTIYNSNLVKVVIHNITSLTEEDIQNWDEKMFEHDSEDNRDSRPLANQTEIIYTVFVNGKPVLATTAAQDMKLLNELEVSTILEKNIFMKAEPYLKEPQATPLIPASKSAHQETNLLSYIQANPILVVIASVAMMLTLLLLLALLLMTRAKRERSAEIRRLSSRNNLLFNNQQSTHGFDSGRTDGISAIAATDGTAINYAYEHDKRIPERSNGRPHISFPLPPNGSRPNSSSTVSTSDSSVYCPVNRPNMELQHMLDEKAAKLFDKKTKHCSKITTPTIHGNMEPIYTQVINSNSSRKRDKKHKNRRRYLLENRVGSINEVHSSAETSLSTDDNISDSFKPDYQNFEHNEAFNLHNNYHRNKLLQNHLFTDTIYDSVHEKPIMTSPTEAINREIIKALQPTERSSETNSIGSYLSMASVKTFPRNALPEPLNRVLEPVSVTYYDHYDDVEQKTTVPRNTKQTIVTSMERNTNERRAGTIASQSDNPDPGVLGPIVWEIHKKKITRNDSSSDSPIHDPTISRQRFEGLIENAIQLYEESPIPKLKKYPSIHRHKNKENRGKSASETSQPSRPHSENRPYTAELEKFSKSTQSTEPPSPNIDAWCGDITTSTVRPLSAGPFHRPHQPNIDITRILVSQKPDKAHLSTAPLIEAIQNELKKFKRDNSQ